MCVVVRDKNGAQEERGGSRALDKNPSPPPRSIARRATLRLATSLHPKAAGTARARRRRDRARAASLNPCSTARPGLSHLHAATASFSRSSSRRPQRQPPVQRRRLPAVEPHARPRRLHHPHRVTRVARRTRSNQHRAGDRRAASMAVRAMDVNASPRAPLCKGPGDGAVDRLRRGRVRVPNGQVEVAGAGRGRAGGGGGGGAGRCCAPLP